MEMFTSTVYINSVYDCVSGQAGIVHLAVRTDDQNGLARQFESLDQLRRELRRTGLISDTWLNDLDQNVRHGLPWESPNPIRISDALVRELKLCHIA